MIILSRSAIDTYNACPQKFYLQYLYNEHGIVENSSDLDLLIGSAIHLFFETIFSNNLGDNHNHSNELMDLSINAALDYFNENISKNPLKLKAFEDNIDYVVEESNVLIEALCYSYWINKFEEHHKRFEFLEVEKEEIIRLFQLQKQDFTEIEDVIYVAKADGLWRERDTNNLFILSNKVISGYMPVTARNYQYSSQNVSELYCVNKRINEFIQLIHEQGVNKYENPFEKYILEQTFKTENIKANNVLYNLLIKGQRKEDPYGSKIYKRNNVLIRPYKYNRVNSNPFNRQFYNAEETSVNLDNYKLIVGSGRLPKGWERIEIWKDLGIRNFIDKIKMGLIQPQEENYLGRITIEPEEAIFKTDYEIDLWYKRLIYKVKNEIVPKILAYRQIGLSKNEAGVIFDINTANCFDWYGKDCSYVDYCHNGEDIEENLSMNLVQIRRPHHDLEEGLFIKKGFINEDK